MIDIVILVLLSIFILKKLKDILGDEHDVKAFGGSKAVDKKIKDIVQVVTNTAKNVENTFVNENPCEGFDYLDNLSKENAIQIKKEFTNFSLKTFCEVSSNVVESVFNAYNEREEGVLKSLLNKEMTEIFLQDMTTGQRTVHLVSIQPLKIESINKVGNNYTIKVYFAMEQIINNENLTHKVEEVWSFFKDIKKAGNAWLISGINSI
jgi:predicted lipid-binding transport protein (Tim44 family)